MLRTTLISCMIGTHDQSHYQGQVGEMVSGLAISSPVSDMGNVSGHDLYRIGKMWQVIICIR